MVMNMPTPLLKSQPPPTPTLQTLRSIRTTGSEENSFYNIHWLAKEDIENQTQTHNHTHTQTWPFLLPQSFGTYQTTVTPFKHICIFSINWEMSKLNRTKNVKVYAGSHQRAFRKGSQLVLTRLARAPPETRKKRNNRD